MNSKVWWVLLVVVVIIILIAMFARGGDSTPVTPSGDTVSEGTTDTTPTPSDTSASKPEMTAEGYYVIRYTASGFSPASLTVTKGDSVRFINDGNDAMSIAPADTVNQPYATFDQTKSIGKGGTYNYTFTSAGSYTYYNLNNKTHVGVVTAK